MMFSSLSSCAPNSQVSTYYTAKTNHVLSIDLEVDIYINFEFQSQRPILVTVGQRVEAVVTSPANYLEHRFYSYLIDDQLSSFAVVNRNLYNPTVRPDAVTKKWFNYVNFAAKISFYSPDPEDPFYLTGFGRGLIDVDSLHCILDPLNECLYFYSTSQENICRVILPAGPIEYKKVVSTTPQGTYTQDLLVLCSDYKIYRIKFDRRYYASDEFKPAPTPFFILDDLPFQEDIPGAGSFLDMARKRLLKNLFPVVTALDTIGNEIYIAGKSDIFVVDINFTLLRRFSVPGEIIQCLSCFGTGAIVTTRSQRVLYATPSGVTALYQGVALGTPAAINNNQRVVVPDVANQRLLVFYDTIGGYTIWSTPDFCPAYARTFENRLFVTGHESLWALEFTNDDAYRKYTFKEKVTLVSSVEFSLVGVHYLSNRQVLDLTGIKKVIPFDVEPRTGPLTHIGTNPVQVTMLGEESITPIAGPGLTVWTNGVANEPISTGDWLGVSYRATNTGQFRSAFIVGEDAFDYDVVVINSIKMEDFYSTQVAINAVTTPDYSILTPTIGNIQLGVTGPIEIDFPWVSYQQQYSNVTITTDGRINFGNISVLSANTEIGSAGVAAIYAVNRDLYQGLPVKNVDPNNITVGVLDSLETPGVYVQVQDLDEFRGLRIRWVGTSMSSYPLGNTRPVWSTTVNHNEIPVDDMLAVNVGDYVSGNNIGVSTQVTGKVIYKDENYARLIDTDTNSILLNTLPNPLLVNLITPKQYSNIILNNQVQGRVSNFTIDSYDGNQLGYRILTTQANTVTVNRHIDANITVNYEIGLANQVAATPPISIAEMRRDLISINRQTQTITSLIYYPATKLVLVSASDYNLVWPRQNITGLGVVPDTTVSFKQIVEKRITVVVNKTQAVEGNLIQGNLVTISVTTVNVPDGKAIPYTISGAGVTSQDFVGEPNLTGTVVIASNQAQLTLLPNLDVVTETVESVSVTFGAVSDIVSTSVSVSFDILDSGDNQLTSASATTGVTEYHVGLSSAASIVAGDILSVESTELEFSKPVPLAAFNNFIYATIRRVYCDRPFAITTPGTIKFQGNFAAVTQSLSVVETDPLLFKSNIPHPSFAYEVGLYSGLNFQFVEVYYSSSNHANNNRLAIVNSDLRQSASTMTQANQSYLFGSIAQSGRWRFLGAGSFTSINQGFVPRNIRMLPAPAQDDTWFRYEFILEQTVPTTSNVMMALSYGKISVNGGVYQGYSNQNQFESWNIRDGDFVTVEIPFSRSKQPVVPVLSIGEYQIGVPAVPQNMYANYYQQTQLFENQPTQVYRTGNITVAATGRYAVPEYYKSAFGYAGKSIKFYRTRAGTTSQLTGLYHELIVGDQITVQDIRTSSRKYDIRDAVIVGPETYRLAYRTQGDPLFDYQVWPTLVEPFVRQLEYGNAIIWYEGEPAYYSSNFTLTANTAITSRLYLRNTDVDFFVNGTGSLGQYITSVSTGANIEMRWYVPTYFESNTVVYQLMTDYDSSNIYVPVGLWPIQNRVIINQATIVRPAIAEFGTTDSQVIENTIPMYVDDLTGDFYPGELIVSPGVIDSDMPAELTIISDTITGKMPELETRITGIIDSDYLEYDFKITGNVTVDYQQQHFITEKIDQADFPKPPTHINRTIEKEYIEYNVILPDIVDNEMTPQPTQFGFPVDPKLPTLATNIIGLIAPVYFTNIIQPRFSVGPVFLTLETRIPLQNDGKLLLRQNMLEFPVVSSFQEFLAQPFKIFNVKGRMVTAKDLMFSTPTQQLINTIYFYFKNNFYQILTNKQYFSNPNRLVRQPEDKLITPRSRVIIAAPKTVEAYQGNLALAPEQHLLSNPWNNIRSTPAVTSDLIFEQIPTPAVFTGFIGWQKFDLNNPQLSEIGETYIAPPNYFYKDLYFDTGGPPAEFRGVPQEFNMTQASTGVLSNVTANYFGGVSLDATPMFYELINTQILEYNMDFRYFSPVTASSLSMSYETVTTSNFQLHTSQADSESKNTSFQFKSSTENPGTYSYRTVKYKSELATPRVADSVETGKFDRPLSTPVYLINTEPFMIPTTSIAGSDVGDPLWFGYNIHSGLVLKSIFDRVSDTLRLTQLDFELITTTSSSEFPIEYEFVTISSVSNPGFGFEIEQRSLVTNQEVGFIIDRYSLYPFRLDFEKLVETFTLLPLESTNYKEQNIYFQFPFQIDSEPIWSTDRLTESGAFRTDIQAYYLRDYKPYNFEIDKQFTLTVNDNEVTEGETLVFTVTTTGIDDGLIIPYSIVGKSTIGEDFVPTAKLTGELKIFGGQAQVVLGTRTGDGGSAGYYEEFEFRILTVGIGTQEDLVAKVRMNEAGTTPKVAGVTPFSVSTQAMTGETLYYSEGNNAALQLGHWDRTETFTQNVSTLGTVLCHGPGSGDFTFSIPNLPLHTKLRYQVFWHFVDSTDNESNFIFIDNERWAEFSKIGYGITQAYYITANVSHVAEGDSVQWTIGSIGDPISYGTTGRVFQYVLTGTIDGDDITTLQNQFIIDGSTQTLPYSFSTEIKIDAATEGPELLRLDLYTWLDGTAVSPLSVANKTIFVVDAGQSSISVTEPVPTIPIAGPPTFAYNKFASAFWVPANYSYAPWGNNSSPNGYTAFDTGLFDHTSNSITVKHRLFQSVSGSFANYQGQNDEAMYLSHVRLSYVPERPSFKARLDEFISFEKSYVAAPGGFNTLANVTAEIGKFVSAVPFKIPGTNFYNMRVLFNTLFYAVPSVPDSYFYKYGEEKPEFTMTVSSDELTEGQTLTVSLSTIGITDGTLVPYKISGEGIVVADFTNITSLSGNFVIQDSQATLSFVTRNNDGGSPGYFERFVFELPTIKDSNQETLKASVRLNEETTKSTTLFPRTVTVSTGSSNTRSFYGDPVPLPGFFANLGTELKYQHVDPGDVALQRRPMSTPISTPKYNIARRHQFPVLWYIRGG